MKILLLKMIFYIQDCSSCSLFRPTGNSGGRFGDGFWYFYPHENMNASCLPTSGWQKAARVQPPFLAPLRPKPVSPVRFSAFSIKLRFVVITRGELTGWRRVLVWLQFSIFFTSIRADLWADVWAQIALETTAVASLRLLSTGHYAFAMASEVQAGVRLQLAGKPGTFEGAQAQVLLSEQLHTNGSIRVPMRTGATFVSNFSLGGPAGTVLEHHEYSNWRFGEIFFTDQSHKPLDVDPEDFTVSAWVVANCSLNATCFWNLILKMQDEWRIAPE